MKVFSCAFHLFLGRCKVSQCPCFCSLEKMKFLQVFGVHLLLCVPFTLMHPVNKPADHHQLMEAESKSCILSGFPWPLVLSSGKYNRDEVPRSVQSMDSDGREPLKIYISGTVQTIAPIMTSESEFRVNLKFVFTWTDERLRAESACNLSNTNAILLTDEVTKLIWLPCPYIVNAKYEEIKKLNRRLISVTLSPSGLITLSMVVNATVDCAMNFQWFPMDSQVCPMNIESFLYDNGYVDYNWLEDKPFQILPTRLLQFDVDHLLEYTKSISFKKQIARNITRLTVRFRFTRIWSNFFIQTFIPCTIIVSISWFSFWLELDATSARGALLATAMLTLVTQFLSLRSSLPPVAYVKAVDVWMFGCILSISAAVAEFTLVKVLYSVTEEIRRSNSVRSLSTVSMTSRRRSTPSVDIQLNKDLANHLNLVLYPSYRKRRLGGSAKLSGRSTATSHLPSRVECSILNGKIVVPLVWTVTPKLDDSDTTHTYQYERKLLWRQIDMMSRIVFPLVYFVLSLVYWIALVVYGYVSSQET